MKIFTWDMGYYCDFRCHYCFFTEAGWHTMEKLQGEPKSPEAMEEAWRKIHDAYGASAIHITGGEPFVYPRFNEIVSRLASFHTVHITSNLSQNLDESLAKLDPGRVSFHATFHPRYADKRFFLDQVLRLRKSGFACDVCYLAHPQQLREMLFYKRFFENEGLPMAVTEFWGRCNGKEYPREYSEDEKAFIRYVDRGEEEAGAQPESPEQPQPAEDAGPSRGGVCWAGASYAAIAVDGNVKPCGQVEGPSLGNLYSGNVSLQDGPRQCPVPFCRFRESSYAVPTGRGSSV